jgi:hypothetical protein
MQAARGFRLIFVYSLGFMPCAEMIGLDIALFSSPEKRGKKQRLREVASLSQISRLLRKSGKQKIGAHPLLWRINFLVKAVKEYAINSLFFG